MAETIKELLETSKSIENDLAYGYDLSEALCTAFNTFGSYNAKMKKLNDSLSPTGQKRLLIFICLGAMEMARSYRNHGGCWDLRKQASEEFAAKNIKVFESEFEKAAGFLPDILNDYECFGRVINRQQFKENGIEYMCGAVHAWTNTHSTLKQAVFGGYVRGVMAEHPDYASFNEAVFPFI